MQVIQTIRDKGAAVVIAVIALSLIGFLLMDAKSGSKGGGGFFNTLSSNVGKVNGEAIERSDFEEKFKQADAIATKQSAQYGRKPEASQIRQQVWDNLVTRMVFSDEAEKLGIDFSQSEVSSLFYSNDQDNPFFQASGSAFIDSATKKLDRDKVGQKIAEMKKAKGEEADNYNQITDQIKMQNKFAKYSALLNASAYYPSWMQEKDKTEAKSFASISYVAVPYGVIADSTIKVTDEEISDYVSKHKKQFKQEEGRMISYVAFSQLPNGDDSAKAKQLVANLKDGFAAESNPTSFLQRNTSAIPFDTSYQPKSKIRSSAIDTILKQPVGTVYGPYVDGGNYVLAKVLATKTFPDSVKARHILIPTTNPQTGEPIAIDSVAKKLADSIFTAIKGGADFGKLAAQFSSDGSKDKGGELPIFAYGTMVPEFNDFCFGKPVGSKDVVKTQFGYHIIEILSQKGSSPVYKMAFMAKEITASPETMNQANLNATKLSGEKGGKEFEAYVAKNGLQKITWPTIVKENDFTIGQLQDASTRTLVKWVFDANEGDVSEPFNIDNQFIVVTLDKIQKEGTQDAKTARPMVEGVIRNQKKAAIIAKNLLANPTLDGAAAFYKQQVLTAGADSSLTFSSQIIPGIGVEPKVIGAAFNKENQAKVSAPIEGANGVYLIKVNSIGEKAAETPEAAAQKKQQQEATLRTQVSSGWFEGLKNQASITDSRSKYY